MMLLNRRSPWPRARKKKPGEKERTSVWSEPNYEIEEIAKSHGQTVFKVEGMPRFYTRNEQLKL